MYEWVDSFPEWARYVRHWQHRAHMIYQSLWVTAVITMLGGLIFFSSNPSSSIGCAVAYGMAALGSLATFITIIFVAQYSFELQRLLSIIPTVIPGPGEEILNIPREEVIIFVKQGPSPLRIFLSCVIIMLSLFLPAFNCRFLGNFW